MRHELGDLRLSICREREPGVTLRERMGDLWADAPRPPDLKKRCHRVVIALASAGKGVSKHCQATVTIVAGSPLRVPF